MLTLLTTTGARPVAFALCERMMARQDYAAPVCWIIVDDGEAPQPLAPMREGWRRIVVRPRPFWRAGDNTQARNLAAGLDAAEAMAAETGEDLRIAVIEDDDHYDCRWLSTIAAALDTAELVGESHARYYNAAMRRGSYLNNAFHASLRASGLRGRAIEALRRAFATFSTYYDYKLWLDPAPSRRLFKTDLTVGMKGLPGRPGIAAGHREMAGYPDPDLTLLREWIGDDAELYRDFYNEDVMNQNRVTMYATGRLKKYENRMLVAGEPFAARACDVRFLLKVKFATQAAPGQIAAAPSPASGRQPAPAPETEQDRAPELSTVAEAPAEAALEESEDQRAEDDAGGRKTKSRSTSRARS